jgi:hypothetical protein
MMDLASAKMRSLASVGASLLLSASKASAQPHVALPPVNLGGSSFMDGPGGPGIVAQESFTGFSAPRFASASGSSVPGPFNLDALAMVMYLGYTPAGKILGGYWGAEIVVPVVHVDVTTSSHASATGFGDAVFSALVFQLPNTKLFGRPLFQRFDLDIVVPSGEYSPNAPVNLGNNVWSVNPYYVFTIFITDRIETSWRFMYLWNSANNAPAPEYVASSIQPGQAVHFNGAVSVAVTSFLRAGVAGYFLDQISDARVGGRAEVSSRERVAGLGPGLVISTPTFRVIANAFAEFAVENRPEGGRFNVAFLRAW